MNNPTEGDIKLPSQPKNNEEIQSNNKILNNYNNNIDINNNEPSILYENSKLNKITNIDVINFDFLCNEKTFYNKLEYNK